MLIIIKKRKEDKIYTRWRGNSEKKMFIYKSEEQWRRKCIIIYDYDSNNSRDNNHNDDNDDDYDD